MGKVSGEVGLGRKWGGGGGVGGVIDAEKSKGMRVGSGAPLVPAR